MFQQKLKHPLSGLEPWLCLNFRSFHMNFLIFLSWCCQMKYMDKEVRELRVGHVAMQGGWIYAVLHLTRQFPSCRSWVCDLWFLKLSRVTRSPPPSSRQQGRRELLPVSFKVYGRLYTRLRGLALPPAGLPDPARRGSADALILYCSSGCHCWLEEGEEDEGSDRCKGGIKSWLNGNCAACNVD